MSLVILWTAPLSLPLVLVGLHLALWRFARQPPPLMRREEPVSGWARVLAGVVGIAGCYLVCALAAFFALRPSPTERTLTLDVLPGSPAAEAGVRSGDVAQAIDGRKVGRFEEFVEGVRNGGSTVDLQLERDGKP